MKSQMEIALTIGTIVIGAILVIVALVISWELLMPLTDALRIAAGIGYDVNALQSAAFSFPGTVTLYYTPPSMCEPMSEYTGEEGNGWICQALLGGNPNITGIYINYVKGRSGFDYGFSSNALAYSEVIVSFNYIEKANEQPKSGEVHIPGFATYFPDIKPYELRLGNDIVLSKYDTPYGETFTERYSHDAIEDLINSGILQSYIDSKNWSEVEISLPPNWAIGFNGSEVCEYELTLNSLEPYYSVVSYLNLTGFENEKIREKFGYLDYGTTSNEKCKELFSNPVIVLYNKTEEPGEIPPKYDPFNQTNVRKYGVGWLKVRCYNLSKIPELNNNISSINLDESSFENKFDYTNNFYISKRIRGEATNIHFNVTYNDGVVTIKVIK